MGPKGEKQRFIFVNMVMEQDSEEPAPAQSKKYLHSSNSNSSWMSEAAFPFSSAEISFYFCENKNVREIPIPSHSTATLLFSLTKKIKCLCAQAATWALNLYLLLFQSPSNKGFATSVSLPEDFHSIKLPRLQTTLR